MSAAIAKRESAAVAAPDQQMEAIRQILSQRTPDKEIRFRKGRGKDQFKYTDGAYIIRTLNDALGHNWDFEADNEEIINWNGQPFEVRCRGKLTLRLGGQSVTKVQYGSQVIEFIKERDKDGKVYIVAPVSIGDCFKGAATDAMKKCASLFGLALDLYDSDFKAENYADDSEPEPVPVSKPRGGYHETLPERPVRLEGAQPKADNAQWPKAPGLVGQIFAKCQALNWTAANLADEIEKRFKMVIPEESVIVGLPDALTPQELKTLDQALAAEFNNRSRTR